MADRYTYIPSIGLFVMVAWGFPEMVSRWRYKTAVIGLVAIWVLAVLWRRRREFLHLAGVLDALVVIVCMLAFLAGLVKLFAAPDDLGHYAAIQAWRWSMTILCLAIAAATGLQVRFPFGRLAGCAGLVGAAAGAWLLGPERDHSRTEILAAVFFCALGLWWTGRALWAWRARGPRFDLLLSRLGIAVPLLLAGAWQGLAANVLESRSEYRRLVVCLDRDTGELRWRRVVFVSPGAPVHRDNSHATPTPVCDGERIVADFDAGLAALSLAGDLLWKIETPADRRPHSFGFAASPVMWQDAVIRVSYPEREQRGPEDGDERPVALTAYDKRSGRVLWEQTFPGGHECYNSPALCEYQGRPAVALMTWEHLVLCDAESGERLLFQEMPAAQRVPTIVADGEWMYIPAGFLSRMRELHAVQLDAGGERGEVRWAARFRTHLIASPVLHAGLIYMVSAGGEAVCINALTGEKLWRQRLRGKYYASPVYGDGKLYISSVSGVTTVIAAGEDGKVLARNIAGGEILASPAVAGEKLFLRTREELLCIGGR